PARPANPAPAIMSVRQHETQYAAVVDVLSPDPAAVRFDNRAADCQSEAAAGAVSTPEIRRMFFEYPAQMPQRYPRTAVVDVHPIGVGQCVCICRRFRFAALSFRSRPAIAEIW